MRALPVAEPVGRRLTPLRRRLALGRRGLTTLGRPLAALGRPLAAARARMGRLAAVRALVAIWAAVWGRLLDEAGGLAAPLVAPLVARLAPPARLVAVPRPDGGLDLVQVVRGRLTPLAADAPSAGRRGRGVELRLRPDQLIERSLTLPLASRAYLPAILAHRIERLTPWRRADVLHGFAVAGSDPESGTLTVRLVMTSAAIVDPALAALAARGLVATAIGGGADRPAEPLPVGLGRAAETPRPRPAWLVAAGRLWLAGTGALAAGAVAATLWAGAAADRQAEAERHLAKARRLVRAAAAGPPEAAGRAARRPEETAVVLIDRLATALPDTAYLRALTLTPSEVRLAGTAADAAALIPVLERAGFADGRFTAPVTRGEDRRDSFAITVSRPGPAGRAEPVNRPEAAERPEANRPTPAARPRAAAMAP